MKKAMYLQTSVWEQQVINNPYRVLKFFFSDNSLKDYKEIVTELCATAFSNQIWKDSSPGTVLHFIAQFETIINAAYIINKQKRLTNQAQNSKTFKKCIGLTLTPEEIKNPKSVFKVFFEKYTLKDWKIILGRLMEYSLSRGSATGFPRDYPVIHIFLYLTKLGEAAFLIYKYNKMDK